MKQIKYTLIGEGFSEEYSLPIILSQLGKDKEWRFVRSKRLKITQSSNPSKTKIINKASVFSKTSLFLHKDDVFIIGVDLDSNDLSPDMNKFENQKKEILEKVDTKFHLKTLVFVPIQAFDYWLLYQKYRIDDSCKKYPVNGLESKDKKEIKKLLYGTESPSERIIKKICTAISEKADIQEMCKQSKSFNKFITELIEKLS